MIEMNIKGLDELDITHDSVMLEACNSSFQVHLQVEPKEFARMYNVAQVATGPVLAAAVNSPLLFGRRLWHETRIAVFQQSVDTRGSSHHLRERSPRVDFGRGWVSREISERIYGVVLSADGKNVDEAATEDRRRDIRESRRRAGRPVSGQVSGAAVDGQNGWRRLLKFHASL